MKKFLLAIVAFFSVTAAATGAWADSTAHSVVGVQGFDLVSYQKGERPVPGNGNHVATVDGVNYLFVNETNKRTFTANPAKYLPAYGGYCAFGAAVGKKFIGDPTVWEVVQGRLYLNLDNKVKGIWVKDISGNIEKANETWKEIENIPAGDL